MCFRPFPATLLLALVAPLCSAGEVPAGVRSPELQAAQEAADAAYEARRYQQAYEIYLGDLAPAGDKYAQYMLGIMHVHGLGVKQDTALGAAWLALAAERGDAQLEAARDEALATLSGDDRPRQQSLLAELRETYADCAIVSRLLAEDRQRVAAPTGSRVKSTVDAPMTVIELRDEEERGVDQRTLRERIRKREQFLRQRCS